MKMSGVTSMLIWKEWREHSQVLKWTPLIISLFVLASAFYIVDTQDGFDNLNGSSINWMSMSEIVELFWIIAAVATGSSLVAREKGNGQLQFIDALPCSRTRVWMVKITVGFAITIASIIVASIVFVALYNIGAHFGAFSGQQHNQFEDMAQGKPSMLAWSVFLFCAASLMSTLFDRAASSALFTVIFAAISVIVSEVVGDAFTNSRLQPNTIGWILWASTIIVCLVLSHAIFVHGETATRTTKWRFTASERAVYILGEIAICLAAVAAAIILTEW